MTPKSVIRSERAIQLKLNREYLVGKRVQIAPHYDLWMQGARYGTVRRVFYGRASDGREITMVAVKMDHPQVKRLARLPVCDITIC